MIDLRIKTNGKRVADSFEHEKVTLSEVALTLYRLEEIKLRLMNDFSFKSEFEVSENE